VVRAIAIVAGAELIERFDFVTYVLGALLLLVALRTLRSQDEETDPQDTLAIRAASHILPLTRDTDKDRFLLKRDGQRMITPLGVALIALVAADITFAVDSIPAAFGITTDALVIWLANAFALVGLIPLLVLVRALVQRFRFMRQTLAAVLAFIAIRLLAEHVVEVGPAVSLAAIAGILATGVLVSVLVDGRSTASDSGH
jgi:tellurite resistance protein TerC